MKSITEHINEALTKENMQESMQIYEAKEYELAYAGLLDMKTEKFQYGELKNEKISSHFKDENEKLTIGFNSSTGSYVVTPLISSTPKDFSYVWETDSEEQLTEFVGKVKIMTAKEVFEFAKTKEVQYYY